MKKFILAVLLAGIPAAVQAVGLPLNFVGGGVAPPATCTYPVDNGCAAAPTDGNYVVAPATFWALVKQSGQGNYHTAGGGLSSHPPDFNIAGVDYPVGYSTTGWAGTDPAVGSLPSGCTYNATGSVTSGAKVTCSSGSNPTFNGWDFTLHNCTPLSVSASVTGTLTITNSKFCFGSNISAVQGTITASVSGTTLTMTALVSGSAPVVGQHVQNTDPSHEINTSSPTISSITSAWNGTTGTYVLSSSCTTNCGPENFYLGVVQTSIVQVVNPAVLNVDFEHNDVECDETHFPLSQTGTLWLNGTTGNGTFKYNAFIDCGRPETGNLHGATYIWAYNYAYGFARTISDGHGEINFIGANGVTYASQIYRGNTTVLTSASPVNCCTTTWYPTPVTGAGGSTFVTALTADHNLAICNEPGVSPGSRTVAGCLLEKDSVDAAYGTCDFTDNYVDPTGSLSLIEDPHTGSDVCVTTWTNNVNLLNGNLANAYNAIP